LLYPILNFSQDLNQSKENDSIKTLILHRIEVSANKIKDNNTLYLNELPLSNGTFINEALIYVPGANIRNYGGIGSLSTIALRAGSSNQTNILFNGFKISSNQNGVLDLSTLPSDLFNNIEISKGAGATENGSGSIGGTVNFNIETEKKEFVKSKFNYGSFGEKNGSLKFNINLNNIQALTVFANITDYDGDYPFDFSGNEKIRENSQFNSKLINANHFYKDEEKNSTLKTSFIYKISERGSPGAVIENNVISSDASFKEESFLFTFKGMRKFNKSLNPFFDSDFTLILGGIKNYNETEYIDTTFTNSFYDKSKFRAEDTQLFIELYSTKYSDIIKFLNIRTEFYINNLEGKMVMKNDSNPTRGNFAFSISHTDFVTEEAIMYDLSFRSDYISEFTPNYSYSFKLSKSFNNIFDWYSNDLSLKFANSFRVPNFNEMYYLNFGNTDLQKEKSISVNLEFNNLFTLSKHNSINLSSSFYLMDVKDKIVSVPKSFLAWTAMNLKKTDAKGIELTSLINLRKINLEFLLNYTYQINRDLSDGEVYGTTPVYIPNNLFNGYVMYKENDYSFAFKFDYIGSRYYLPANEDAKLNDVLTFNFLATAKIYDFNLSGELRNITNQSYQMIYGFPMPGINFRLSLSHYLDLEYL